MAAIDKTYYKTKKEYTEALERAQQHWLEDLVYDYKEWWWVLWNTSEEVDAYIFRHCNIEFIQDRLKEQYGNSLKYKWKILVEWLDWWDSEPELVRTVIDKNIHSVTFPDILREITWMYYKWLYAYNYWEIRDTIKILSITNLSF